MSNEIVAAYIIFGLFSRIFVLIYLTNTPKMVHDMFKTVITIFFKSTCQHFSTLRDGVKHFPICVFPQVSGKTPKFLKQK